MSSFEFNKIAAAILIAGIIAVAAGIIANNVMKPHELDKLVIQIDGMDEVEKPSAGGTQQEQGPGQIAALLAAADLGKGEAAFKKCAACHTIEKAGAHRQGPNLWGVVGAKVAHHGDYKYSKAMAEHGGDWNFDTLNGYLFKPARYVKGTKMTFVGIKDDAERANLIAYLRNQSDSPLPLPAVTATAPAAAPNTAAPADATPPAAAPQAVAPAGETPAA